VLEPEATRARSVLPLASVLWQLFCCTIIRQRRRSTKSARLRFFWVASRMKYFTPSGRSIQAKGISPDIVVQQDIPEELRSSAEATSEASLRGHLLAEGQEQTGSQAYVPQDLKHDKALKMALDLIHGRVFNPSFPPKRDR
jgi:hypothetical protein